MRVVLESEMSKQDLGVIHEWITAKGWFKDPDHALAYIKTLPQKTIWESNAVAALLYELDEDLKALEATECKKN